MSHHSNALRRAEARDEANGLSVAVVGATGVVGEVLLDVLEQRALPVDELRLLASERSAGAIVRWQGRDHRVLAAAPDAFEGVDLVFFAATGELSRELAPAAVRRGAVVIDKSSTWRMDAAVPLVVPEINAEALDDHRGIIACPNCTTIGVAMALAPLERVASLRKVVVTTLQAASGAGRDGVEVLDRERSGDDARGQRPLFAAPLHDNVVPLCEAFADDAYSTEEHKLRAEVRKILSRPSLPVSVTCVRVPVAVGHSASILIEREPALEPDRARRALQAALRADLRAGLRADLQTEPPPGRLIKETCSPRRPPACWVAREGVECAHAWRPREHPEPFTPTPPSTHCHQWHPCPPPSEISPGDHHHPLPPPKVVKVVEISWGGPPPPPRIAGFQDFRKFRLGPSACH